MDSLSILHRFADNTITDAERAEFTAYLQTLSLEDYEALMEQYEAIHRDGHLDADPDPALLGRILGEIDKLQPLERGNGEFPHRQTKVLRWPTLAAAAACLFAVAGLFLYRGALHHPVANPPATAVVASIAPGGNKAVLTLANGATVVLDSTANGRLTAQGAADVVKTANGKLQYQAAGSGTGAGDAAPLYNTLTTPRGGQYQVVLSDGTRVWLNAASAIRYPATFTGANREVEVRGEAYFEVARDNRHPFIVSVAATGGNHVNIDVLGTSFNIDAYQDAGDSRIKATLLEGAVRVTGGSRSQVIRPGQQAAVDAGNIRVLNDVDLESVLAWKNGKLVFTKGDIRALMQEIGRWYDVDVKYQGRIPSGGFYGLIDRNVPLAGVLRVLGAYGIQTKLENKTIIVQ